MSTIEQSIDVEVPVRTAYNQWTQFEEFPKFMDGVIEVRQLSDTRLAWRTEIGGVDESWEAEIDEQIPDARTRVMLQLQYDPQGVLENVGDVLGAVKLRVKGDLQRFKEFIESLGAETGGWRGTVQPHQAH